MKNKLLLLMLILLQSPLLFCGYIPVARVGAQILSAIGTKVFIKIDSIEDLRSYFIKQSKERQHLDLELFDFLIQNNLNITLQSHRDFLTKAALRETPIGRVAAMVGSEVPVYIFSPQQSKTTFQLPFVDYRNGRELLNEIINSINNQRPFAEPRFELPLGNGRVYLEARYVPESSLLDQLDLYERQASAARYAIEHFAQANQLYFSECETAINLLKKIMGRSDDLESLAAQLSVNSLFMDPLYDEGVLLMKEVRPQLQNLLFDKNKNFHPIDSLERQGEALAIIAPCLKAYYRHIGRTNQYVNFLEECIKQGIPRADTLLKRATNTNGFSDKLGCWFAGFVPDFTRALDKEIEESRLLKNYVRLESYCKANQFEQSKIILSDYENQFKNCNNPKELRALSTEHRFLKLAHEAYYGQVYNNHDIKYEHTDDPYYQLAKIFLESCPLAEKPELLTTVKETIDIRQKKLSVLFEKLGVKDTKSPFARSLGYALIDAKNSQEIVTLLSPLSIDHENAEYRELSKIFYKNNTLKLIDYNNAIKAIAMPQELMLSVNAQARFLYGLCGCYEPKSIEQEVILSRAVHHLAQSCSSHALAKDHLYLADKLYRSLVNTNQDSLQSSPDFNKNFATAEQNQLRDRLMSATVKCFGKLDSISAGGNSIGNEADLQQTLADTHEAFTAIEANDVLLATRWVEKIIEPTVEAGAATPEIIFEREQLQLFLGGEVNKISSHIQCDVPVQDKELPQCGTSKLPERNRQLIGEEIDRFKDALDAWICGTGLIENDFFVEDIEGMINREFEEPQADCGDPMWDYEKERLDNPPQCNWGKQQGHPSFGEAADSVKSEEENKPIGIKEAFTESAQEKKLEEEEELNETIKSWKALLPELTEEQAIAIDKALKMVDELGTECGIINLIEGLRVCGVTGPRIVSREHILVALKEITRKLKKINSDEYFKTFKFDSAHGNKVTTNSVQEAIAGIACIEQGILKNLKRSTHDAEEFVETENSQQCWDVKTARSSSLEGKRIFDAKKFVESLIKAYRGQENIIIQVTDLNEIDAVELYQELAKNFTEKEIARTVVVHAVDPAKSKTTKELLKFLGKTCLS